MSGDDLSRLLEAGGTLLLVIAAIIVVERMFRKRARKLARRLDLDPVMETRLRFVRRLVESVILLIGLMSVLSQFTDLDRFAASVLASGAIAAAVIGFAAQQSLGNVIAGVLLAVTQPIRIGDAVDVEGNRGVVEDVRLAHTLIRTGSDARIVVPNGRLAQSIIRNDSLVTATVAVDAELWLSGDSDELRALEVLTTSVPGVTASIKAVTADGTTLAVSGPPAAPSERESRRSELLRDCLAALREAELR